MMTNNDSRLYTLKGITPEEFKYLQQTMYGMTDQQNEQFMLFYMDKRKSPSDILLFTLLGFIVIAGVQRFVLGQIGMGLLYFFTGGLCLMGTTLDAINHKSLANEFNRKLANEITMLVRS
jgi:TM2 domain-containing membrane protein YozV